MSGRYTDVHGDGRHLRFTPEPAPSPAAAGLPLEDVERVREKLALAYSGRTPEAFADAPKEWRQAWYDDTEALLPVVCEIAAEMRPTAAEEAVRTPDDLDALPLRTRDEMVAATLQWMAARGYRITHPAAPVPPDANGGEER